MFMRCEIFGGIYNVWVPPRDLWDVVWRVGTLAEGQVWGQLDSEGPYRPCTPSNVP